MKKFLDRIRISFSEKNIKERTALAIAAAFIIVSFFSLACFLLGFPFKKDLCMNLYDSSNESDPGLVLYFNNNSYVKGKKIVCDLSGNKNNGVLHNVKWNPNGGKSGRGSFDFRGINSIIRVKNSETLSPATYGNHFTVSFFARFDNTTFVGEGAGNNYVNYIIKGEPGSYEWEFREYNSSNDEGRGDRLSFYAFNPQGGLGVGGYFQEKITPGEWIYITGVIDGDEIKIYKNSVLMNTQFLSQENIVPALTGSDLYIGSAEGYFTGSIDEFRIYGRTLSDSQIRELYLYSLQK